MHFLAPYQVFVASYVIESVHSDGKQPFAGVFQNRCSKKFHNIHRKTPVSESLFNKNAALKASGGCLGRR